MTEKLVDARGLSCPQPVLETKRALDGLSSGTIEVLVETVTSRNNVLRIAEQMGCRAEVEELDNNEFKLTITKG